MQEIHLIKEIDEALCLMSPETPGSGNLGWTAQEGLDFGETLGRGSLH
jgi:hypothetical protein